MHVIYQVQVLVDNSLQILIVKAEALRNFEQGRATLNFGVHLTHQHVLLTGLVSRRRVFVSLPAGLKDLLIELQDLLEPQQIPLNVLLLLNLLLDEAQ